MILTYGEEGRWSCTAWLRLALYWPLASHQLQGYVYCRDVVNCVITYPAHVEEIFIEDPLNAHLHRRRRGRTATTCTLKSQFNLRSEVPAGVTEAFRTTPGKL